MFGCRLLLFVICLTLAAAPTSSQEFTYLTCFDPECSTSYLTGEVIIDLPEHSLSKGTAVAIYGQSASGESYLIKVGEHSYHVHGSFLRISGNQHEIRSMVRVKLSRLDSSNVQPNEGDGKSVEFSTVSPSEDLPSISKEVTISTQQIVTPSPSEEETFDYRFLEQQERQQGYREEPAITTSRISELSNENIQPSQPVEQEKGLPFHKLQLSEGSTLRILEHQSIAQGKRSSPLSSPESKVPASRLGAKTTSSPVRQHQLQQLHSSSDDVMSGDQSFQRHQQQQEHQQKPASTTLQSSGLQMEIKNTSRPVQRREKAPLSTPQPSKDANVSTLEYLSPLEKRHVVEETGSTLFPSSESNLPASGLGAETMSSPQRQHQLQQPQLSSEKPTFGNRGQGHQQKQYPQANPGSIDSGASGLRGETIEALHSVKHHEGAPLFTPQATENANMGPLERFSGLGKSQPVEETRSPTPSSPGAKALGSGLDVKTSLPAGQQNLRGPESMPQAGEGGRMQTPDFQPHGPTLEVNTAAMHVEKPQVQQLPIGQPRSKSQSNEMMFSSGSMVTTKETTSNTEKHQELNRPVLQEPISQVESVQASHQNGVLSHSPSQAAQTLKPRSKTAGDQSAIAQSQFSVPLKGQEKINQLGQVVFEESSGYQRKTIHPAESKLKNAAEVASTESVNKASSPREGEDNTNEANEPEEPSYTPVESHLSGIGEAGRGNGEDSPLRPLVDIAAESTFFHCLSYASSGSFMFSSINSSSHIVQKSILAGTVLFFARQYFNTAQILLLKLSPTLVSSLDRVLTFTFNLPLVFFIAWLLFISSILITWLLVKLFSRLLFVGLVHSNPDDPTRRSLAEWLAVEENVNLLAGSLADKEEAYARLVVWSTKVSERYEYQARNHSTSETRIHNQLRDMKASLADSLQENKELRVTHDALVEQLSSVKTEAAVTATRLREEVSALNSRLEECTRHYADSIEKEKELLVCEINNHQSRAEKAEKMVSELKEANQRFEEDLATRERELSSLREAFIEMKSAELKGKKKEQARAAKKSAAASAKKQNEDMSSTDGWEVEDEIELDKIIEEIGDTPEQMSEVDGDEVQSSLNQFLEVGRLRVALEDSEKRTRAENAARKQEAEMRTHLQGAVEVLKGENADLLQRLRVATEDCDASKKKLEILSEYFKEREAVLQRDLGRQALSESESIEELKFLRSKQESHEVEIKTLRDQLASARRELAESERISRRHISEMDKRLHESWLSARALENVVKDLRGENSVLRQKMFTGERAAVHKLLSGIPPPPPPPPPAVALASARLPEMRSTSRQSEKSIGSHPKMHPSPPPPPFLPFPQIPLTGPGGSQFIPPPPPPPPPPSSLLSQRQQMESNRQSPIVAVPTSISWDAAESLLKSGSNTSESNRPVKHLQHQR